MIIDPKLRLDEIGSILAQRMSGVLDAAIILLESVPLALDAAHSERYEIQRQIGGGGQAEVLLGIVRGADGFHRLAPAYDQLCTRLVIADDPLALPVGGKRDRLTRDSWFALADYAELPRRAAQRVLDEIHDARDEAVELVQRSFLEDPMRSAYRALLDERTAALAA